MNQQMFVFSSAKIFSKIFARVSQRAHTVAHCFSVLKYKILRVLYCLIVLKYKTLRTVSITTLVLESLQGKGKSSSLTFSEDGYSLCTKSPLGYSDNKLLPQCKWHLGLPTAQLTLSFTFLLNIGSLYAGIRCK